MIFGLVFFILLGICYNVGVVFWIVGFYIIGVYWFILLISFVNLVVIIVCSFMDMFFGINLSYMLMFIIM